MKLNKKEYDLNLQITSPDDIECSIQLTYIDRLFSNERYIYQNVNQTSLDMSDNENSQIKTIINLINKELTQKGYIFNGVSARVNNNKGSIRPSSVNISFFPSDSPESDNVISMGIDDNNNISKKFNSLYKTILRRVFKEMK